MLIDDFGISRGWIMHKLGASDQSVENWYNGVTPRVEFYRDRLKRMVEAEQRKAEREREKSK